LLLMLLLRVERPRRRSSRQVLSRARLRVGALHGHVARGGARAARGRRRRQRSRRGVTVRLRRISNSRRYWCVIRMRVFENELVQRCRRRAVAQLAGDELVAPQCSMRGTLNAQQQSLATRAFIARPTANTAGARVHRHGRRRHRGNAARCRSNDVLSLPRAPFLRRRAAVQLRVVGDAPICSARAGTVQRQRGQHGRVGHERLGVVAGSEVPAAEGEVCGALQQLQVCGHFGSRCSAE